MPFKSQAQRRKFAQLLVEGKISPDADADLLVDLLSGPIFYRQLLRRARTSDADVRAIVSSVLASVRVGC